MEQQTDKEQMVNTTTVKKNMNWDKADHERGLGVLSDFLFGIHRKEDEEGFMDIEFKDSFKDEEIKIFMKLLKRIVEHGENKKNEYQNIKSTSFCSGLTHLNKYAFPYFSKAYSEWTIRKRTDERISKITEENNRLRCKLSERGGDKETYSSDENNKDDNGLELKSKRCKK